MSSGLNFSNGLIRTPNAWLNNEGSISFLYSNVDPFVHGRVTVSPYDWFQGSFFYTDINTERYAGTKQSNKDKGFALKLKIKDQGIFPAISVGLEDIAGTVLFSSEYLVSSYKYDKFDISLGIGWGSLGSLNNFENPFLFLNKEFDSRPGPSNQNGGTLALENYFRGDASIFGGVKIQLSKQRNISFKLEYDSMNFNKQRGYNAKESSRYNYGLYLEPTKNSSLGLYRTEGNDFGFSLQFKKDFSVLKKNKFRNNSNSRDKNISYIKLLNEGKENGILVQKADLNEDTLYVQYIQTRRNNEKIFAKEYVNFLNENYENFDEIIFTPQNGHLVLDSYSFKNSSLKSIDRNIKASEGYEFQPKIIYPVNTFDVSPGTKSHIGSPSGFLFAELNLNFAFNTIFSKGLELQGIYTYPIIDNYKNLDYDPAYTDLHPVRIDAQKYLKNGQIGFDNFFLSKLSQMSSDEYLLIGIGHLEQMYSGLYFEYLKDFSLLNLQLGLELSYVKQRDFDKGFIDFLDYEVLTSHFNISYYEPFFDLYADLSFGRYLAKDDGFTFSLSRGFKNGLEIGAFFTLTNISEAQFGEGSFDKGVFFNFPIDLFQASKSKGYNSFVYRPLTRDGGSKVHTPKDLISILRDPSKINY